jgi:hypothetical protein
LILTYASGEILWRSRPGASGVCQIWNPPPHNILA